MKPMKTAIIGAGLIGKKRADSIRDSQFFELNVICDKDKEKAEEFAGEYQCRQESDWRNAVSDNSIDAVIVATTNDRLAEISNEAIKNRKHVLIEKPAGVSVLEIETLIDSMKKTGSTVKVGYNHRFHPLILQAHQLVFSGSLGPVTGIIAEYGHRGRNGYDKEWRSSKKIAGGGELIDQGSHLIDLSNWFIDSLELLKGTLHNSYWNMEVEDTANILLGAQDGKYANLNVSCARSDNVFRFEIFCKDGTIRLQGLHGSYGSQTMTVMKRAGFQSDGRNFLFEGGTANGPSVDISWREELREFENAIKNRRQPLGNLYDALKSMRIIQQIYGGK